VRHTRRYRSDQLSADSEFLSADDCLLNAPLQERRDPDREPIYDAAEIAREIARVRREKDVLRAIGRLN